MGVVFSHGPTAEATMVNITMTESKVRAFSLGLTGDAMTAAGLTENNMVSEFIIPQREKLSRENGVKVNVSDGWEVPLQVLAWIIASESFLSCVFIFC
jgi:hypothetical protein